mmetsp:Transcript_13985/g.48638  ORF Transcript_13985/g.48638 Transcript_13985/m.48638 type:complete len:205 (+) Transcript_13985:493-1107(+)
MSHILNVMVASAQAGSRRVVFASSNHVMGGYKDDHVHETVHPTDPPMCGTTLRDEAARWKSGDAVAYAAAKLAGERLARTLAAATATEFVTLRIGWCQPGLNTPETLSAAGVPPEYQTPGDDKELKGEDVDEAWFKGMWLSNADFLAYFTAAIDVRLEAKHSLVNAMSKNTGARWSLHETEMLLSVQSVDDSNRAAPGDAPGDN